MLSSAQSALQYRPINDEEIQDTVRQLYSQTLSYFMGVQSDKHKDSSENPRYLAWVLMLNRNQGAYHCLDHEFKVLGWWDIECTYEVTQSEQQSDADMLVNEES